MNVEIKNVLKTFGSQKAVNDISFSAKKGEILGFLGPNGAGKTTTMKMITGYLGVDMGSIEVGGISVENDEVKKHIGYLPEHNPLYLDMPVMDYLQFAAEVQGVEKSRIAERMKEVIILCGLDKEKHKLIGELSKGYRQRVGLAQSIIHDPEVLILDEPTTGLDPNQIVQIRDLIKRLGREKTVIFSTHILPEVEAVCDRIVIINKGQIVADGTTEVLSRQTDSKIEVLLGIEGASSEEIMSKLHTINQVKSVDKHGDKYIVMSDNKDIPKELFKFAVDQSWILTQMSPKETKLEDVFRDLTV